LRGHVPTLSMAPVVITREFQFDAAHRILGHRGQCAWLHGHSYRIAVTVEAPELDALGMVMDFERLGCIVRAAIVDRWDPAALLSRADPLATAIAGIQAEAPERLVLFAENPTAEVLSQEAFHTIAKPLPEGITPTSVTVWETSNCRSEYRRADAGD